MYIHTNSHGLFRYGGDPSLRYSCSCYEQLLYFCSAALHILVSPTLQTVAEGARVSFECMVEGNLVEELNWTRDFESLDQSKVNELHGRTHSHP